MTGRRFHVLTYGCRVNQADSADLARQLPGWRRVGSTAEADLVVLNTCTVTHRSDADVRKAVHRIQRERPQARVVVTGCMAQRAPDELVGLGVDGVLSNAHKSRLAELVSRMESGEGPVVLHRDLRSGPEPDEPLDPVGGVLDRSRPFVKIQDGCDAHCTYCIIPDVRGRARSAPPSAVVDTIRRLSQEGHHEVVLTGIHLGTYGARLDPPTTLPGLVDRILDETDLGLLRLSCMEPMQFPLELVARARDRALAPHFHLPLQAGSDRTLKRMVRPYRADDFVDVMQTIRRGVPDACLGTDVIVGFPGETSSEFEQTLATVERADLDYVHVFSYSDRSGTASERLKPKTDPTEIKRRSTVLNAWSKARWTRFLDRWLGTIRPAVTLEGVAGRAGWTRTLTDNYAPVLVRGSMPARNRPLRIRIERRVGSRLEGTLADNAPPVTVSTA